MKMISSNSLRMRCAFRYLFAIFVLILVFVSIQLALVTDRQHFFKDRQLLDFRDSKSRSSKMGTQSHLSFFLNKTTNEFVKNRNKNTRQLTWSEYQQDSSAKTGNALIDNYGKNDLTRPGENGVGVHFVGEEKEQASQLIQQFNLNVLASDKIPLNRMVPDSRFPGCRSVTYENDLPTASIIVPFFDEWPSILLRTIYSIVNRTPRKLLKEIILVDDGSQMEEIKSNLDTYIESHFPMGLVKVIRVPKRLGLIQARLIGYRNSTGDVIIFFDSHMEVNIDWLQPLLTEVKRDRRTIAMGALDYIQLDSMQYKHYTDYMTRYGFDWRLVFFETFFRNDQVGPKPESTRPGTVMVGAAYAIDRQFFHEIGEYDEGMKVWGGENLEMAWRIWLCGGRLVHAPCSHIGHVARSQPYSFPGGREHIEQYNYKRAIEVWMEEEHKELIYNYFPNMKTLDAGDLSARRALKARLQCKPFSWFMDNIWPELFVLTRNVSAWGSARNLNTNKCLDNHNYLFQAEETLFLEPCHYQLASQGFSMTRDGRLRTSLQCVVVKGATPGVRPKLEDCIIGPKDTWTHSQSSYIKHDGTGLCLDIDDGGVIMRACDPMSVTQLWQFNTYVPLKRHP
ncbi:polypeptide N-acetylgalactosaminyltransferase 13-like [Dreissena polymorpha]|uniref:Polypeptide N-acetylgalactosaminyltransferase n=1 Tax=Dreissena polymorpha TaxID=45954 RepID=A0A9D4EPE8_DREPO|nr:polypeptide N-acetylgalactosaminyltransferase 13-like [Dreissena polymorpha]XP_052225201.1 polypeptide N-acetylgalactosaminyltransferase 13-like [Dreissena polymorpha]XP_052225202.1 polypeptide N-acetylgalactosaminyltransferase 13-like [Dreissena polymorpha]XP_052225203.1 polypeptide N-acetylgalactosaminyltransferase 13-like [Dreissena polymorpha]XP_052225205.1 polypeptide N-acetylgalactosaminyltransferase 13-like [Dreissena polymorpha]XP_052225206.1 polypeptide N-acetylgalactosaminyltransf